MRFEWSAEAFASFKAEFQTDATVKHANKNHKMHRNIQRKLPVIIGDKSRVGLRDDPADCYDELARVHSLKNYHRGYLREQCAGGYSYPVRRT